MNIPPKITRHFIQANRTHNFIFGESQRADNDYDEEADACRGEPNTFGITTCTCFDRDEGTRYFQGEAFLFSVIQEYIKTDVGCIPTDKPVVVLRDVGLGKSLMKEKTPKLYEFMIGKLKNRLKDCEVMWL